MLELKNITKIYPADSGDVVALKEVSLQFRKSEFVSILGPSGCGKTTLLNIIGGLDQYSSGDLVINGRSTKHYKDRDWDAYRNHSVGFVFQSYNLIPHQTVLANVELALTLSGVSKAERRKRAKEALEKVGLGDQLKKRPNQLSGGQMQRVAIARAIVNNPDIILADEPTGALDTQTSIQVMEILKEISQDRLVIMVTHNPELAETYSSRIVRLLDGQLISDSQPLTEKDLVLAQQQAQLSELAWKNKKKKREKKPSMSWFTSFGLSLKNLISKKGRTTLTAFAGSIGIIGIALIYAVSQGMTTYINALQEDTLASYPITIQAESLNTGSLLEIFMGQAESHEAHENDKVYQKTMLYDLINALNTMETTTNDLEAFKVYLDEQLADPNSELSQALSGIQYTYDLDMLVYTETVDGTILRSDTEELMNDLMAEVLDVELGGMMELSSSYGFDMSAMTMSPMGSTVLFQEMLPGKDGSLISPMIQEQYDVIYGSWPNSYDEIVLIVDENNELDDLTLYALGLKSKADIDALADAAINKQTLEVDVKNWTYQEICDREYKVIFNSDCYVLNPETGLYEDHRGNETTLRYLYDNALPLKVTGIIRPNEDAVSTIMKGSIGYTSKLTEYVIENSKDNPAIQAQLDNPDKDIFSGLPFKSTTGSLTDAEKAAEFKSFVDKQTDAEKLQTYVKILSIPSEEQIAAMKSAATEGKTRAELEEAMKQAFAQNAQMQNYDIDGYLANMSDEKILEYYEAMAVEMGTMQYAQSVQASLQGKAPEELLMGFQMALDGYTEEQMATYYDKILEFSDSSYEDNLLALGYLDLDSPSSVNLYAVSFESKEVIESIIAKYNEGVDELHKIQYTDFMGIMMDSITTIINAITYVLIAFVSVSLIVSSIMIGVITLISVQERTKEIGVLRAIGASKRNVSNMFNAETILIGFASGVLGVVVTVLLCYPINAILLHFTNIPNLKAYLPWQTGVILVVISVLLTMLAGLIPARSAAKKDPVVALRTE